MPLHEALFVEANPVPVKYAAERLGLCRSDVRLPLSPLLPALRRVVDDALARAGLLLAEAVNA
jgi:4-hydroxy-tetrahydrodipicolinate synthase